MRRQRDLRGRNRKTNFIHYWVKVRGISYKRALSKWNSRVARDAGPRRSPIARTRYERWGLAACIRKQLRYRLKGQPKEAARYCRWNFNPGTYYHYAPGDQGPGYDPRPRRRVRRKSRSRR